MAHTTRQWFSFWLVLGACGVGCSDEDSTSSKPAGGGPVLPETTVIMGQVLDIDGNGISGVSVQGGGAEATSAADGSFEVDAEPGSSVIVTLEKEGYLRGIKRVDVLEDTPTALEVVLAQEAASMTLDADAGGTVEAARGAALVAPLQAFVDQDGAAIGGDVDVHLTPLDPSVAIELAAYPGDLRARTLDGDPAQLETFGVLDVTVRKDGEDLQIADGQSVQIRIPSPSSGAETPPATVGLWSFEFDAGEWVEEGALDYNAETGTYDGTITHLSPWNADQPVDATAIGGTVVDDQGQPVPGAWIDAQGVDYLGGASATADEDGAFCVVVRKDSVVQITAIHPLGGGSTLEVDTGSTDTSIPPESGDCIDLGR
jgi:hypothetical protein